MNTTANTWVLTDLGAFNFLAYQQIVNQLQQTVKSQQAAIIALGAEVAKLKTLPAPKVAGVLPTLKSNDRTLSS